MKRTKCPRGCVPAGSVGSLGAAHQTPEARALWLAKQISKWSPAGRRMQGDELRQWRVRHFFTSLNREGIVLTSEDYKRLTAVVIGRKPLPGFAPGLGVHPGLGAYGPGPDQRESQRSAQQRIADRNRTFLDIQQGPNPLSPEEIDRLIERHPGRYEAYRGYGAKARGGLRGIDDGSPLDDFEARDLLYQWHGGGGSGVYQVASMMDHGVPAGAYERARWELVQVRASERARKAAGQRMSGGPDAIEELDALIAWLDEKIGEE